MAPMPLLTPPFKTFVGDSRKKLLLTDKQYELIYYTRAQSHKLTDVLHWKLRVYNVLIVFNEH